MTRTGGGNAGGLSDGCSCILRQTENRQHCFSFGYKESRITNENKWPSTSTPPECGAKLHCELHRAEEEREQTTFRREGEWNVK